MHGTNNKPSGDFLTLDMTQDLSYHPYNQAPLDRTSTNNNYNNTHLLQMVNQIDCGTFRDTNGGIRRVTVEVLDQYGRGMQVDENVIRFLNQNNIQHRVNTLAAETFQCTDTTNGTHIRRENPQDNTSSAALYSNANLTPIVELANVNYGSRKTGQDEWNELEHQILQACSTALSSGNHMQPQYPLGHQSPSLQHPSSIVMHTTPISPLPKSRTNTSHPFQQNALNPNSFSLDPDDHLEATVSHNRISHRKKNKEKDSPPTSPILKMPSSDYDNPLLPHLNKARKEGDEDDYDNFSPFQSGSSFVPPLKRTNQSFSSNRNNNNPVNTTNQKSINPKRSKKTIGDFDLPSALPPSSTSFGGKNGEKLNLESVGRKNLNTATKPSANPKNLITPTTTKVNEDDEDNDSVRRGNSNTSNLPLIKKRNIPSSSIEEIYKEKDFL